MSRQNFYKQRKQRRRQKVDEALIITLVKQERRIQPRLGCRKLRHVLNDRLSSAGISLGRDRFFRIMRRHRLLIERHRCRAVTTDSRHRFRVYGNLLKDTKITAPGQALVSDITYIRSEEGFMYLALVMDAYSRAIVGYDCSDSLESEGALKALSMAMRDYPKIGGAIHHSDRGSQYCSRLYVERLRRRGIRISMTEANHCYENSQAERLNGILKQEYGLGGCFLHKADVLLAVEEAVDLYNWRRPHQSLGYRVPMAAYQAA